MKNISPVEESRDENRAYFFHPVGNPDGTVNCSCGRELIKMDEKTYRCAGGWPTYRMDEEDIILDKFGNLMMREKSHDQ